VRFLAPTGNKRSMSWSDFLCLTVALLMALALLTYNPKDAAFNVSAPPPEAAQQKTGLARSARMARSLFPNIRVAAFLLPAAILVLGWRWFRSRAIDSPVRRSPDTDCFSSPFLR